MATDELYQIDDPRFLHMRVGSARLEELFTGCRWAEGPVWFNDLNCLLWSDIPNQRILRWTPDAITGGISVFRTGPISPMAIRVTGRGGSYPANMEPAA